jgi:hypothetical protein
MRALLALATVLMLASPAWAVVLFSTDFENATVPLDPTKTDLTSSGVAANGYQGAPPGWILRRSWGNNGLALNANGTDMCTFQTAATDDTGLLAAHGVHSGTKALRQDFRTLDTVNGSDTCSVCRNNDCNAPVPLAIPGNKDIWIRAWILSHNYGLAGNNHNKLIYLHSNPDVLPNMLAEDYSAVAITPGANLQGPEDCPAAGLIGPACLAQGADNSSPNLGAPIPSPDAWHCYEWHFRYNSAPNVSDALLESWVDTNTQYMSYGNFRFMGPDTNQVTFGAFQIYRQGASVGSVVFWDDVAVGDARIGCGQSLPGTPANLTISGLSGVLSVLAALMRARSRR